MMHVIHTISHSSHLSFLRKQESKNYAPIGIYSKSLTFFWNWIPTFVGITIYRDGYIS